MSDNSLQPARGSTRGTKRGSVDESAEPHFIAVGRVAKPHGIRGEVRVELLTDLPERFKWLKAIYVGEHKPRLVAIESVRFHQGFVLLKLAGYPTRTEAELLRGELLQVPESEAIPLEEGEYFLFQLSGLQVFTELGEFVGQISDILETGANNVFVIDGQDKQFLVPDIPDVIASIDIENDRMEIRPFPGLLND